MSLYGVLVHVAQVFINKSDKPIQRKIKSNFQTLHLTGKTTMLLLIFFSVLCTSYENLGAAMRCVSSRAQSSEANFEHFCLQHGTYTIDVRRAEMEMISFQHLESEPDKLVRPMDKMYAYAKEMPGTFWKAVYDAETDTLKIPTIYPGIPIHFDGDEKYLLWTNNYKWVPLLFLINALSFAYPLYLWKRVEGGLMYKIVQELHLVGTVNERRREQIKLAALRIVNLRGGAYYSLRYYGCELLNLFNIPLQFYLTHLLFNSFFYRYGYEALIHVYRVWMGEYKDDEFNPMIYYFPRMTKCKLNYFGQSADKQADHGLCTMSVNSLLDKLMLFLWLWYILLMVLSSLSLCVMLTDNITRLTKKRLRRSICRGHLLILDLVRMNVDDITFSEILREMEEIHPHVVPSSSSPHPSKSGKVITHVSQVNVTTSDCAIEMEGMMNDFGNQL